VSNSARSGSITLAHCFRGHLEAALSDPTGLTPRDPHCPRLSRSQDRRPPTWPTEIDAAKCREPRDGSDPARIENGSMTGNIGRAARSLAYRARGWLRDRGERGPNADSPRGRSPRFDSSRLMAASIRSRCFAERLRPCSTPIHCTRWRRLHSLALHLTVRIATLRRWRNLGASSIRIAVLCGQSAGPRGGQFAPADRFP